MKSNAVFYLQNKILLETATKDILFMFLKVAKMTKITKMMKQTRKHVNYGYVNWRTIDIEGTYRSTLIELGLYNKNENTAELV